jgi:UDP-2,4-diacetamido-2,4,6-trideoxy-beta-L-altropyranose hydrolase
MSNLVAFRADASLQIGTGHVMRCLTLADSLKAQGVETHFICREHPGHLIDLIRDKGHLVHSLPFSSAVRVIYEFGALAHADWLGTSQAVDAELCAQILRPLHPDWLIVDHYALDECWEKLLSPFCKKLMVIDDLADRKHICNLLLDQNFGRSTDDYLSLIPSESHLLCGSQYALLRPEFATLRAHSLMRRSSAMVKNIIISMGGVDGDNATQSVLTALQSCPMPSDVQITVVMGKTAPWLHEVKEMAKEMPWPTEVKVNVNNMAELMSEADISIGGAGSTSWERCCLGLPSILIVLAANQKDSCNRLELAGACKMIESITTITIDLRILIGQILCNKDSLLAMQRCAAEITDGKGTQLISDLITSSIFGVNNA